MKKSERISLLSRREVGSGMLVVLGGVVAYGCGGSDDPTGGTGGTSGGTSGCPVPWASGGTKSMSGSYPDPFTSPPTTCALITAATEGPCTEAADQIRNDISEGYPGVPVRLALRIVNGACEPIADAKVKIWHTHAMGSYSGDTPSNGMCLKDQADSSKHYFRGVQNTDSSGRVDFDTCLPGWYPGRCVHIHFTVTSGSTSYTSQVIFDQALVDDICKNHVDYKANGMPDTTNARDGICGRNVPMFTLAVERMCDGAMLASKVVVVNV
jgi:protocatechuate 3,4-dioxygenase beta subunit